MTRRRRIAIGCLGAIGIAIVGIAIAMFALDAPRPIGEPGEEAERTTDRMLAAIHADAWERTGAITWTFSITGTRHLWDRARSFARVRWDDVEVQVDLDDPRRGVAMRGGRELSGDEARRMVRAGWERFINDSFWLCAPFKARDAGTSRALVGRDLLVSYASGGVTPGDAYLWILDDDGTPRAWRIWAQVLPVGGVESRWEDWITLPTGARIARRRAMGPVTIEMGDLVGAERLDQLEPGPDPFAVLERVPAR